MLAIKFVGRYGTREDFVERLGRFLVRPDFPGYVSIWGVHGVGKSRAVGYALEEAEKLASPGRIFSHRIVDHDYKSLDPEGVANSIADFLGIPRKRFTKRNSIDKEGKDWEDFVDWIDQRLEKHGRGVSSVVIWLAVSDLDASHAHLAKLFKANLGRTATRKLILEEQKPNKYLWNLPEPFYKEKRKLGALSEDEATELLSDLLKQIVGDPALIKAASAKIQNLCGTHPGLIVAVCEHWESRRTPGKFYRNVQEVVKSLADMIDESYEVFFLPDVKLVVDSLSDSARSCLIDLIHGREIDIPDEINEAGILMADGRVAELIERFFKDFGRHRDEVFDTFISYNSNDRITAIQITEALRQRNVNAWIDRRGLHGGVRWMEKIVDAVSSSSSTVVLVSDHKLGYWQGVEVELSLSKRKLVIPVLLPGGPEPDELPPLLGLLHCLDFRGGLTDDAFDGLASTIRDETLGRN
jgi:TIR domain-containing protein